MAPTRRSRPNGSAATSANYLKPLAGMAVPQLSRQHVFPTWFSRQERGDDEFLFDGGGLSIFSGGRPGYRRNIGAGHSYRTERRRTCYSRETIALLALAFY